MHKMPIFLIGSERSGTNLLRTRLNNHSRILAPVPPHILKWLYYNQPYYGNLTEDKNFISLIKDVLSIIDTQIIEWEIKYNYKNILQNTPKNNRSLMTLLINSIYHNFTLPKSLFFSLNFLQKSIKSTESLMSIFKYIHDKYAQKMDKARWFSKENNIVVFCKLKT